MKHIYIVRHGETDFNKESRMQGRGINSSLNETGEKQAKAVANFLKDKPISQIITSSMHRAIESAIPFSMQSKIQIESFPELEEMNFGDLEGKKIFEVKDELQYLHKFWSEGNLAVPSPGGENPTEVFSRANNRTKQILVSSTHSGILFVIHGRLIRILLSEWLGLGLKNMHQIEHQNGAINYLTWEYGVFSPVELNITHHLSL